MFDMFKRGVVRSGVLQLCLGRGLRGRQGQAPQGPQAHRQVDHTQHTVLQHRSTDTQPSGGEGGAEARKQHASPGRTPNAHDPVTQHRPGPQVS